MREIVFVEVEIVPNQPHFSDRSHGFGTGFPQAVL